ncbi:RnfABCDGE type electron transport complex subunit G [Sporosalibacterium faouarense]|uniref:RnfABCDGE type electron transport complex subunit G n=1 Tax=Sporosalibacterium faouarense TaxID=516123 RepID=UPI00141C20F3|nr:RnfABCDGE type electron transport complex subunit G [Bacillota bacterium]
MREVIKLGLILLLITSVAAIVLGLTNSVTEDVIQEVEAEASKEARLEALPQADSFKQIDEDIFSKIKEENSKVVEVYVGYSGEEVVGYAIKTATPGYGANIEVITGISVDNQLTGMKVGSHQETPGLGANATKAEFQNQYKDKSTDEEIVVVKTPPSKDNEIQALTGATISSNAVTDGVNIAREIYNSILAE